MQSELSFYSISTIGDLLVECWCCSGGLFTLGSLKATDWIGHLLVTVVINKVQCVAPKLICLKNNTGQGYQHKWSVQSG